MVQCRAQCIPLSGPVIKKKAQEIAKKLEVSDFCASNGWLDRYKQRHRISFHQISTESESACLVTIVEWLTVIIPHLTKGYEARNIFNADECALFFKLMPDKSHVLKGEKCYAGKLSKERITILRAVNLDGTEKLLTLAIGKSAKPRCFKNIKELPCDYKNQRRALMTAKLFHTWLLDLD